MLYPLSYGRSPPGCARRQVKRVPARCRAAKSALHGALLAPFVHSRCTADAWRACGRARLDGSMTARTAPLLTRPDGSPVRVLVVDDEVNLTELIAMALRYEGWDVRTAGSGTEAVRAARDFGPDAVVLDMMLPDFDGMEVLRRMRADEPEVPVLFLTARDSVEDRIAGLTAGGDDYVTKPFSLEEVVARLRALMRRTAVSTDEGSSLLVVGDLTLDEDSREVVRGGAEIELTATEFELLRYLMRNPRRVLSKTQILDRVWDYDFGGQANVVELYISYLRKKVDAGRAPMIHTKRGAGYVIKPAS
ncbi:MAG: DNA-binding response regulator [Kytococcus sp.]|nr:DNA-binding response regulator [Kytococcus sp.]